jgi:hypothetical protein
MLIEIPHEVSKAYRQKIQIINRLAVIVISSREKKSISSKIQQVSKMILLFLAT